MTKFCKRCKKTKPVAAFAVNRRKSDGLQTYCKGCKKDMDAAYYAANKQEQVTRVRNGRNKLKREVDEIKRKAGCKHCGEDDPSCLDFHHKRPGNKVDAVARLVQDGCRRQALAEIKKCEVVCANCHRKHHKKNASKVLVGCMAVS